MVSGRSSLDPEWLEFRTPGAGEAPRTRRRRGFAAAGAVIVIVLVGGQAVRTSHQEVSTPRPLPPPTATSAPAALPSRPTASARRTPLAGPTVITGAGPLVAEAGDWELVVRGDADLFRIQIQTGRIVRTEIPPLALTGEFSFVAGPHDVVVAPRDSGVGVLVPDDRAALPLPGLLAEPGAIFPADDGRLWYQRSNDVALGDTGPAPVVLTGFDGRSVGAPVPIRNGYVASDGHGHLLLEDAAGATEIDQTATQRVTTGSVTAVGPHHYLIQECDADHLCSTYLYDRSAHRQRRIGSADVGGIVSGLISPDGTRAVLIHWDRAGPPHFVVLDLRDGTEHQVAGSPDSQLSGVDGNVVWSPDGRWLFALVDGHLSIVDVETGQAVIPDLPLPPLRQITLRAPTRDDPAPTPPASGDRKR